MVSLWWLQLLCSWQHIILYVASYISMQELCMNSVARCLNHHNYVTDRVKSHTQKDQSAPFHASWVVSEPQWTMHPCFCKCIHLLWVMVIHAQFQLDFHAVWESWDWGRETGLRLRARLRLATNSAIKFPHQSYMKQMLHWHKRVKSMQETKFSVPLLPRSLHLMTPVLL